MGVRMRYRYSETIPVRERFKTYQELREVLVGDIGQLNAVEFGDDELGLSELTGVVFIDYHILISVSSGLFGHPLGFTARRYISRYPPGQTKRGLWI